MAKHDSTETSASESSASTCYGSGCSKMHPQCGSKLQDSRSRFWITNGCDLSLSEPSYARTPPRNRRLYKQQEDQCVSESDRHDECDPRLDCRFGNEEHLWIRNASFTRKRGRLRGTTLMKAMAEAMTRTMTRSRSPHRKTLSSPWWTWAKGILDGRLTLTKAWAA